MNRSARQSNGRQYYYVGVVTVLCCLRSALAAPYSAMRPPCSRHASARRGGEGGATSETTHLFQLMSIESELTIVVK